MPKVRDSALRKRVGSSGEDETHKLNTFRTLYYMVYNDDRDLTPLSIELFHVLGEILEGTPPSQLSLHRIDKELLLLELAALD